MNGRMNRLRRSISRSVHQLSSLSRQGSLSGLVQLPTSSIPATLGDRFATPSNYNQLQQTVRKNNDSLKEIISILEEKANLDFHYSKMLKKLSARLHKVTHEAESEIDKGWVTVAEQFDVHATLHSNLGSAMTDDVIQPLRSVQLSQQKTIRAADSFVEKETHKLKNKKEDVQRTKRSLYDLSRQLEKAETSMENETISSVKSPNRRQKLHDQVVNMEDVYIYSTIDMEKQRRVTESVLRKGVESLEAVERQRLVHCQTALGRYQRKVEQLAPNLQQMFERFTNNLDLAVSAQSADYIQTLQPTTAAVNHIVLADVYAENFGEVMSSERRRTALLRIQAKLDKELTKIYNQGRADVMATNTKQITLVEFLEYLFYKINDAINSLDGGQNRTSHRLSRFQHKLKDKSSLPMTVLSIPLSGEDRSLPPPSIVPSTHSNYAASFKSDDYEEYDKISDEGFCSSSTRPTTVIDEPVSASLCRALYDFMPKHDDEIQIKAGEVVIVEDRIGTDWLVGHVLDPGDRPMKTGRFPTSYVVF